MESQEIEHSSVLDDILTELKNTPVENEISTGLLCVSALEMMSQLMSGKLNKRGNQKRFDRFLAFNSKLNTQQREVIYLFRNALVHAGGRFASTPKGQDYRFLFGKKEQLIFIHSKTFYEINLELLKNLVLSTWEKAQIKLTTDDEALKRYQAVLKRIGHTPT